MEFYREWKESQAPAPVDPAQLLKEELQKQISSGAFGSYIQAQGYDTAIARAKNLNTMMDVIDVKGDKYLADHPVRDEKYDQWDALGRDVRYEKWAEEHFDFFEQIVREEGLLGKVLYQTDENSAYMVLTKKILLDVVKNYAMMSG